MRIRTTITEMSEDQWVAAQQAVKTDYEIPEDASRVCLVFEHNGEERHAEMPLSSFAGLLMSLGLTDAVRSLREALEVTKL